MAVMLVGVSPAAAAQLPADEGAGETASPVVIFRTAS